MKEFERILTAELLKAVEQGVKELENADSKAEEMMYESAKRVAKANKALFDAHLEAGFSANYAIQIVVAQNHKK